MRKLIAILLLLLFASAASAESIAECVLQSPYDSDVLAWQSPSVDFNLLQYDVAPLWVDYPVAPDYVPVLLNGERVDRAIYWSDTYPRRGWTYRYDGAEYLFIFGDHRLPGVLDVERRAWHGACLLRLS